MKHKDIQLLHQEGINELKKKLAEKELILSRIARDRYARQSKNVHDAKILRIDVARIKTIIRQKELSV